ncbi:HU family DNA-binding protein [Microcoleus sp. F10-C6]|uniref:HU family DNA-binding protein n=1 Tax=unclassified Microcoleus TaxID=2642155 RepID=UPI002FD503AB
MNLGDLENAAAHKAVTTKKQAALVIRAFLDSIVEGVASGEKVTLVGFGTFEARDRQAREGRNPKTGETMDIPATVVPAFSAGKGFKDAVALSRESRESAA